ncbi:transmembrane amino acid transporter protein-domain-containing protein [Aspergillus cavernicola]|uniref:Transmembrane amino acid transporter protein-domain-containing protein n=1 Tax=Aspergillus cavernicola TaxID=176166 RepID=A0ABR4IFX2_9EURO
MEKQAKLADDPEAPLPIRHIPSQMGEILEDHHATANSVFGEVAEDGPNYHNVGWLGTVALMMKTQIGLGVLSIPSVFHTLGLVPGVTLLCVVSGIAMWTSYIVGVFKLKHPQVYGIDDAYWIFVAGSGILGISISLNAVSGHGTCTAAFVAISAVISFAFASIRTLGKITWVAWLGLVCIIVAVFTVVVSVGIQDRPASAPQDEPWKADYKIISSPSFAEAIAAVSSLIFACSATPAYFSIVAEMRDPRLFTRSLLVSQIAANALYLVVGIVTYYYCGSYVASPALGSAGPLIKRISYGIALPGLVASTTIFLHLPSKYIFVRILRRSEHLTSNTFIHWCTWLSCTFGATLVSYIIASGIPVFNNLVSLIGALLGAFLAYQPTGCMWLYDNWKFRTDRTLTWTLMACWSVFIIVIGTFMTVAGTYGAIVGIIESLQASGGSKPWTCVDNSI